MTSMVFGYLSLKCDFVVNKLAATMLLDSPPQVGAAVTNIYTLHYSKTSIWPWRGRLIMDVCISSRGYLVETNLFYSGVFALLSMVHRYDLQDVGISPVIKMTRGKRKYNLF